MTLREYIDGLNEFLKENPQAENLKVVHSSDDEGNGFHPVIYTGQLGFYEDGEFISSETLLDEGFSDEDINSVCIN